MSQPTPPPLPTAPAAPPTASAGITKIKDGKPHYYRLGIVGSKASGKTCLLAALSMARTPNPLGCTAVRLALEKNAAASFRDGDEWINSAVQALARGEWPDPTPNEDRRRSLRFRFTDGKTRQKYVELFDYSGELLNPAAADSVLAERLRGTLREVDGLLVLAEHPSSEQDAKRLEHDLNGLLRVFSLLNDERRRQPGRADRQVPIALLVNKWDRSPHFDPALSFACQMTVLAEKFLKQTPPPFHQTVANTLRPAADECFKVFPVSAIRPTRQEDGSEVPPTGGALHSMGVEDPFLWLIECVDDRALKQQRQHLFRLASWWMPPLPSFLLQSDFKAVKSRFESHTPEGRRAACLSWWARLLTLRQLALWLGFVMAVECGIDFWQHRTALSQIESSVEQDGWQKGVAWLRGYGESSPFRHTLYDYRLPKREALEKANEVVSQKDHDAFELIKRLMSETKLQDAGELARQQLSKFPNSRLADQRKAVIAEVERLRVEQEFEKQLNKWRDRLVDLSAKQSETKERIDGILQEIRTLEAEIRDAANVPLQGTLREQWSALLASVNPVRLKWAERLGSATAKDKIKQALDAGNYLDAADLLAVEPSAHPELLNQFQLSLPSWLREKIGTLSEQGAKWAVAVEEAEKYLQPSRRPVLTPVMQTAIEEIMLGTKRQGDSYLYELALKERNNASLDQYLSSAPLKSMAVEVSAYRQWLEDRQKPRAMTFRLMKIEWHSSQKAGWTDKTKIKLFVNGQGDSRNADEEKYWREGTTAISGGLRSVELSGLSQAETVKLNFQTWNVWWGDTSKSSLDQERSAEDWVKNPHVGDSAGNTLEIHVDGVLPEPHLPAWHLPQ
ncbi:MAG: hypothetical protein HS117_07090 [Verrucomicrobiaceae bacterium]|nr:hypothetical protein [Verrucomicrobiaceae bacterium]